MSVRKTIVPFAFLFFTALPLAASTSHIPKRLYVDVNNPSARLGDSCGSRQAPCLRITDAVARARAIRFEQMREPNVFEETVRPIEIVIAPGSYFGTFGDNPDGRLEEYPFLINVPHVALRGATVLTRDNNRRPNVDLQPDGTLTAVDERANTVLRMNAHENRPSSAQIILVVPTVDVATGRRSSGIGASIEGLSFDVGAGPVLGADRAFGFVVRNCAFTGTGPVEVLNSNARFEANLFSKGDTAIVVNVAGSSRPNRVVIRDNTSTGQLNGGAYVSASGYDAASLFGLRRHAPEFLYEPFTMPPHTYGRVIIENNRFDGATANANLGFGIRIVGTDGQVSAPATSGAMDVTVRDNELTNNRSALLLDGGFPLRVQPNQSEQTTGPWVANIRVYLAHNVISGNLRSAAAVSFTRIQAAIQPRNLATFKYAESSTFEMLDPSASLSGLWIDHLERDPSSGRTLGNTFIYNGVVIPPPVRSCGYPTLIEPFAPTAPCTP